MNEQDEYSISGFIPPVGELMPGFLIPCFAASKGNVIQELDGAGCVKEFLPVDSELVISLSSAEKVFSVFSQVNIGRVKVGDEARFSFFQGSFIVVGIKSGLIKLLEEMTSNLSHKFREKPRMLAGLFDYIGDDSTSSLLRARGEQALSMMPGFDHSYGFVASHFVRTSERIVVSNPALDSFRQEARSFALRAARNSGQRGKNPLS